MRSLAGTRGQAFRRVVAAIAVGGVATVALSAPVVVTDDADKAVAFDHPPRRIVTLAPSLTELVFAAGGGGAVVAADRFSDFPAEARSLARVGDVSRLDVERILALRPDLVVVWNHGNTNREVEQLEAAGVRLFRLEPQRLDEVPRAIERLGQVLGTTSTATAAAAGLRQSLAELRDRHAAVAPVRVFYQVWSSPLMTINRRQMVSEALALCGGQNVFAELSPLVPQVALESVLAVDPEAIFTADERGARTLLRRDADAPAFAHWKRHPRLAAVKGRWLYVLNGDAISRQGPRIVDGVRAICDALDQVRAERAVGSR